MLIRVKNGYLSRKDFILVPYSKFKLEMTKLLIAEGYLLSYSMPVENRLLKLVLKYTNHLPSMTDIKIVSKPSLRIYKSTKKIPRTLSGLGITIISTPKGLKNDKIARRENIGGEVICQIW